MLCIVNLEILTSANLLEGTFKRAYWTMLSIRKILLALPQFYSKKLFLGCDWRFMIQENSLLRSVDISSGKPRYGEVPLG